MTRGGPRRLRACALTLVARSPAASPGAPTLAVPWDDKELTVEFATFRDKLAPGRRESFRVTVKDAPAAGRSEAGAAELLASMYDRSLDSLRALRTRRARSSLFPKLDRRLRPRHFPPTWRRPAALWRPRGGPGRSRARWTSLRRRTPSSRSRSLWNRRTGRALRRPDVKRSTGRGVAVAEMSAMADGAAQAPAPAAARGTAGGGRVATISCACRRSRTCLRSTETGARSRLRSNFAETAFWRAAPAHRRRRLGDDRVHRPRLGHLVAGLGRGADARPRLRLRREERRARQGADGPPLPAALPARGRRRPAQGGRQQRRRNGARRRGDARDLRSRDERDRCSPSSGSPRSARRSRSASSRGRASTSPSGSPRRARRADGFKVVGACGQSLGRRAAAAAAPAVAHPPRAVALRHALEGEPSAAS